MKPIEESFCGRAGDARSLDESDLPPYPKPDRKGRFSAEEYARISLACDIIRSRREARLTQTDLARRAGIRQETLGRIESGKSRASVKSVEKIEKALEKILATGRRWWRRSNRDSDVCQLSSGSKLNLIDVDIRDNRKALSD